MRFERWIYISFIAAAIASGAYAGRNGSGTYVVPNTAVSGATISSADWNENFDDLGDEITNSLALDGQSAMSGQIKSAAGTVGAPGISMSGDLDSGFYRIGADNWGWAASGVKVADFASSGLTITGDLTVSGTISGTSATSDVAIGSVFPYAGSAAPSGYLLMYGQCVDRTTYADLFSAIGTAYDNGCSGTQFGIPDMRGRTIAGQDDMGGVSANRLTDLTNGVNGDTLGDTGGLESFTLATANLPSHSHTAGTLAVATTITNGTNVIRSTTGFVEVDTGGNDSALGLDTTGEANSTISLASGTVSGTSATAGSGTAMGSIPPTIILNYIIRTGV
jgi:microcystin-dependent protein